MPGQPKGTSPSKTPAQDVGDAGGNSTGAVDAKKFKALVSDWGRLPPREQQRALQELTNGMAARHREAIENYFKSLNNFAPRK